MGLFGFRCRVHHSAVEVFLIMDIKPPNTGTAFNGGMFTNERFNAYLKDLHTAKTLGEFIQEIRILKSTYDELVPFLDEKEISEGDHLLKNVNSGLFYHQDLDLVYYDTDYEYKVHLFNRFISIKLREKGLLMPIAQDPNQAILG